MDFNLDNVDYNRLDGMVDKNSLGEENTLQIPPCSGMFSCAVSETSELTSQ